MIDNSNNLPGTQPEQKTEGMNRRQALAALGKLAIYTAPVLTTLTMKVDHAAAASLPTGPPSPPGSTDPIGPPGPPIP